MFKIFLVSVFYAGALLAQTTAKPAPEMCGMMKGREAASGLADKLAANLELIRAEKDPLALQQRFAEQAAILKELREALKPDDKMADKMKAMQEHMRNNRSASSNEGPKDEVLEHQKEHSHQ